ncbi:hypothetical protein DPMN_009136 [Dreissena polymorpha]|uniref:Reverse transcriptase domain-containing protein n=1 Tax=Dreissena polymorpha TaxID=45954 RepID=A0A9D4MZZ8_DREPO|nr:hypothetical protein DPMN_009136 [Dreissena polymorpha]
MMTDINIQQGGFQESLGCLMTSFMLRESVYFAREHGSKLYVCYLDGRQAFDKVWHDGLFYKLQTKIDDTSLLAFMELYANMTTFVVVSKIVAIHRNGSLFVRELAKAGKVHRTAI